MGGFGVPRWLSLLLGGIVVVGVVLLLASGLFYMTTVAAEEVIVRFSAGRITQVAGPGLHWDIGLFKSYQKMSRAAFPFSVSDPEVLTKAPMTEGEGVEAIARIGQAIGIVVAGDVFRPGPEDADFIESHWAQYKTYYTSDEALAALMERLSKQAMKVCIGERTFEESVVGEARDRVRVCIAGEVVELATNYGLQVRNLVVPDVILDEHQKGLIAEIGSAKFKTEVARQQRLQALAEGERDAAIQEAKIRVEQAVIQEKARQDKVTWGLKEQAFLAQKAAITAEKANLKLTADKDLEITQVEREVAIQKALAKLAPEIQRALMMGENPDYVNLLINEAWAEAWNEVDKVFISEGMNPTMIMGGGVVPTIEVGRGGQEESKP